MARATIDIAGHRFGRWTVLSRAGVSPLGKVTWIAKCDCGVEREVIGNNLKTGISTSCGCYHREIAGLPHWKHGRSHTPLFRTWAAIQTRCYNENFPRYKDYGGRGITVCQRWRDSFEAFAADMGEKPTPEHSIDRINNDGNYEPGNCRWATRIEQANNKRRKVKRGLR